MFNKLRGAEEHLTLPAPQTWNMAGKARKAVLDACVSKPREAAFTMSATDVSQLTVFCALDESHVILQPTQIVDPAIICPAPLVSPPSYEPSVLDKLAASKLTVETAFVIKAAQPVDILLVLHEPELVEACKFIDAHLSMSLLDQITIIVLMHEDRAWLEFGQKLQTDIPWRQSSILKLDRVLAGTLEGQPATRSCYVCCSTRHDRDAKLLQPRLGTQRLLESGATPKVYTVDDIDETDIWACQVHRDRVQDFTAHMEEITGVRPTPISLGVVFGADRFESRTMFPRIDDAAAIKLIALMGGTPRFALTPLGHYRGEAFKDCHIVIESFHPAARKEAEAPFAWMSLVKVTQQNCSFIPILQMRGPNKVRIGFTTRAAFEQFLDKALSQLKGGGFVFKVEGTGQFLNDGESADAYNMHNDDPTITSYITDVEPWKVEEEVRANIDIAIEHMDATKDLQDDEKEYKLTRVVVNTGEAAKKTWKIVGDIAPKLHSIIMKSGKGDVQGIVLSHEEYVAKLEVISQAKKAWSERRGAAPRAASDTAAPRTMDLDGAEQSLRALRKRPRTAQ